MKKIFSGLFYVFFVVSIGQANTNMAPNGSFETGADSPDGWVLKGSGGKWGLEGLSGTRAVNVTGTGEDMSYWHCPIEGMAAGYVYRLSFYARCENEGGNVVAGCGRLNYNFKPGSQWEKCSFVFMPLGDASRQELRLGQWHRRGATFFDNVTLTEVTPVNALRNGMALGGGEMLVGNQYTCNPFGTYEGGNYSRCLDEATAEYHTDAWVFSTASHVIYKHQVGVSLHQRAEIRVKITHHVSGCCFVDASSDKKNWIPLGKLEGRSDKKFEIPQDILPANAVYIRLRASDFTESSKEPTLGNFQIGFYVFRSELNTDFPESIGYTGFFDIRDQNPEVEVKIASMDSPIWGGDKKIGVSLWNRRTTPVVLTAALSSGDKQAEQKSMANPIEIRLAPDEKKSVFMPYSTGSAGENTLDLEIKADRQTLYRATASLTIPDLYDASYGYALGQNTDLQWWWCESTYKVSRERAAPAGGAADPVKIFAARGEYEPVQVVLRPKRDLKNVRVAIASDEPIWKDAIGIYTVAYHEVQQRTDAAGCVGWWPDALPPYAGAISLRANLNQPLWVLARVPENCPAGDHKLSLTISGDGGMEKITVPMTIHVYDFRIPTEGHIQSAFGLSPDRIKRYHNLETVEEEKNVWELYMQSFRDHRISPYDFAPFDPIKQEFRESGEPDGSKEIKPVVDFSAWDVQARKYLDGYGFTGYRLPLQGMGDRKPGQLGPFQQGTPAYRKAFTDYCLQFQNHLEKNGWLDKTYIYWFDEPEEKDYEFVRAGMEEIKLAGPKLPRMLTEQPEKPLFGAVDIWCPVLDQFVPEACQKRQQQGDKIWWYLCTGPKTPYPTLFIDHNAIELRIWLWMSWKWDMKGILIWETNYWTSPFAFPDPAIQNPWQDPMGYCFGHAGVWGNGDGRMLYPPNRDIVNDKSKYMQGPVSSIRWEMLREGMEDYEYFWLLKASAAKARQAGVSQDILTEAQRLLDIPQDIIPDLTHFTRNPQRLYQYRRDIAQAIEKLSARSPGGK